MEVFNVDRLSYTYKDGKNALDGISFSVNDGESLTIVGTNGSGKSTLLYLLDGLLMPESGSIKIFGRDLNNGFLHEFRQRVSLLFQNPQVQLFSLSVWDDLCFGPIQLGLSGDEARKRAEDVLRLLGIEHLRERCPWNLSGGEMKKVAIGTCLSINPDVMLLDEPTTGLDPRSQVEVIDLINALRKAGKTIIVATHDLGIIEDISDRTIVLGEDHRVLLEGKPWEVIKNTEALLDANLIHRHTHRHCWYVHEHSHFGGHEHEHINVYDASEETEDNENHPSPIPLPPRPRSAKRGGQGEGARGREVICEMTDLEKLKKLLEHWMQHNTEHAKTYTEWAGKAEAMGENELAKTLKEIADETARMEKLFQKAKKVMNHRS
ncbi:MAG: ABC transporter ATP-binding protein [Nitrospirae bacterium]|nr:ABC transporter ATP-binding protein [Nitrospirota bacterium]